MDTMTVIAKPRPTWCRALPWPAAVERGRIPTNVVTAYQAAYGQAR